MAKRRQRSYTLRTKVKVTDDGAWAYIDIPVAVVAALGQKEKDIDVRVDVKGEAFHAALRLVRDDDEWLYEPGDLPPVVKYTMLLYKDMVVRLDPREGQTMTFTFVCETHLLMRRGRRILRGGKYDKRRSP